MHAQANHLRQNPLTEQWVIYAPDRSRRPHPPATEPPPGRLPEKDAQCPFCPGNETMLPAMLDSVEDARTGDWLTRTVANKYPALTPGTPLAGRGDGLYRTVAAIGRHEVIIESPRHNVDLPAMTSAQVQAVVESYCRRYRTIQRQAPDITNILIFRNHGPGSGTSLIHPHSQLIATAVTPTAIRNRERIAARYFEQNRQCLLCAILDDEIRMQRRCVYENASFVGFVPFAADVPCELWLVPRQHAADFASISLPQQVDLADALGQLLSVLAKRHDDPDYNFVVHSCSRTQADSPAQHWFVQIRPRTVTPAGFEIGSGIRINPSLPEEDARRLRP
jgi:UDPglucose--hexose-1-phosphate uridylyltransferase